MKSHSAHIIVAASCTCVRKSPGVVYPSALHLTSARTRASTRGAGYRVAMRNSQHANAPFGTDTAGRLQRAGSAIRGVLSLIHISEPTRLALI
eukprot:12171523-Alexandrium_andersonii.AAC.1